MEGINDQEFIARLEDLKKRDIGKFMDLVLESLKTFPDLAVEDDVPIENKISALKTVIKHFEEREDYEDCAFIRDLQKKIEESQEEVEEEKVVILRTSKCGAYKLKFVNGYEHRAVKNKISVEQLKEAIESRKELNGFAYKLK